MDTPIRLTAFTSDPTPDLAPAESRRAIANRLNARKSTGPRTDEGKANSRRNALKHGLSGSGVVLPRDLEEEARDKAAAWAKSLMPKDAFESELVAMGAATMSRLNQCWREESAARRRSVTRAELTWESDRRSEVARLAERLAKSPERISTELRATFHGAEWLAARWSDLARRLDAGRDWTAPQRSLALDLLGVATELRDDLTPIDFLDLTPAQAREALVLVVAQELDRLHSEIEGHLAQLDEDDRAIRAADLAVIGDPVVDRLTRYERTLSARVLSILSTLRRGPAPRDETKPTEASPLPDETKPIPPIPVEPAESHVIPTEPGPALTLAPSLLPSDPDSPPEDPEALALWLRSRSDAEIESILLPLMMARLHQIETDLREQLGQDPSPT